MERKITKRLVFILEEKHLLPNQQFGFRKNRSTTDVLITLESGMAQAIRKKISLDISKAYDTCWRYAILKKLKEWKIDGKVLLFITNFTKDRSFRVKKGNTFSTEMNIQDGIVQGAVINVTLFLIAMTDICKGMEEPTKMVRYAEDWIIYTSHILPRVAEARLKKAADKVIKWTNEYGFRISAEKTKWMFMHRINQVLGRTLRIRIWINNVEIEMKNYHRILGMILDQRLNVCLIRNGAR
jgi:hypothetical protein